MPSQQTGLSHNYAAKDFGWPARILFGLLVLGSALFFGLAAGVLPWFFIVAFLVLLTMPVLAWFAPEYALLVVYAVHLGLLPPQLLGHIVTFVAISGIFVLTLIRNLGQAQEWWPILRPYGWSYGLLMSLVAAQVVRGLFFQHTQHSLLFNELEPYMMWLGFPILTLSLNTERRLKFFLVGLIVLGLYVALGQGVQTLLHHRIFFAGGYEEAETLGRSYNNVIRSVTPAIYLLMLALYLVSMRYLATPRLLLLGVMTPLLMGLLFTFGRALIVFTLFVLFIVGLWLSRRRAWRMFVAGAIVVTVVGLVMVVYKPDTFFALFERLTSINIEVRSGSSLGYRIMENEAAIPRIESSPLLGIGLGQFYRQPVLAYISQGTNPILQSGFIHNGYLYVLLKLGAVAFLAYSILVGSFYAHARRILGRLTEPSDKAIVVACVGILVIPLFTSMVRPDWMSASSTAVFAICFAIVAAVERFRAAAPAAQAAAPKSLRSRTTYGATSPRS